MRDTSSLDPIFQQAADQYGLPVSFLKAVGQQESGLNVGTADSYQGAQGLMQMLPATAVSMGAQDPRDPTQAIPAAAKYLRQGLDATGSLDGAAAYYHGGPNQRQWGPKTANYVQSVASIYNRAGNAGQAIGAATGTGTPSMPSTATAYASTQPKGPADMSDDELDALILGKPTAEVTGGRSAPAPTATAQTPQSPPAASAAGSPADMSDDQLDALILGKSAGASKPGISVQGEPKSLPPDAKPGPNGLVWNADGGYDPKTGALVMAGKPMTDNSAESPLAVPRTGVAGFVEGLPIVGPYAKAGAERGAAAYRSLTGDTKYSDELAAVQGRNASEAAAHPYVNTAGQVAGGVVGTLPAVAAAPAAFGISEAGLPTRMAFSALTNGGIGATDAAVRSGGDPTATAVGGGIGAGFGFAAPGLSRVLTGSTNALMDAGRGVSSGAKSVNKLLDAIGMTPGDARDALARLGPTATLADINPALTTEAGALAARGGPTTSTIKTAMQARAAGADDQASQLVTQHLGPKPDLNASISAIEDDAATRAGPHYTAGRAGAPLDVTPILADIDAKLPNATGGVEDVLNKVRGYLTDKAATGNNPVGLTVPKSDPGAVLAARQALDDAIEKMPLDTSAGKNAYRMANNLRNQIDSVVKTNPDFAAGDTIHAQSMGIRDAMQEGADVFKRNVRPEDLQRTLAGMTPEQRQAYQAGARAAIGNAMEDSTRGQMAGAQTMFARGSANRAKLDALFPSAQEALDALHAEVTMRGTERQLINQSVTAERQTAMQRWAPKAAGGLPSDLLAMAQGAAMGDPSGGVATAVGRRGFNALIDNMRQAASQRAATGAARGFVATGPEQDAFLNQLTRAGNPLLGPGANAGVNLLLQQAAPRARNRLMAQ